MRRLVLTCCLALCCLLAGSTASGFAIGFKNLVQSQFAPNVYTEQPVHPDAGDVDAPQNIQGTNITEIDGIIGIQGVTVDLARPDLVCLSDVVICCPNLPGLDCADAFRFSFDGGPITFSGIELINGVPLGGVGPDIALGIPLPLQLFSDHATSIISPDNIPGTCVPGFACF